MENKLKSFGAIILVGLMVSFFPLVFHQSPVWAQCIDSDNDGFCDTLETGNPVSYYSGGQTVTLTNGFVFTLPPVTRPSIVSQPANQAVRLGASAMFAVTATGADPLNYQWQFSGTDLADGGRITGSQSNLLTLVNVRASDAGHYQAIVANTAGSITSAPASLGILGVPVQFASGGVGLQLAGDGFHLQLIGLIGHGAVLIEASTNLTDWYPIFTNHPAFGGMEFVDPAATNYASRYYRATTPAMP